MWRKYSKKDDQRHAACVITNQSTHRIFRIVSESNFTPILCFNFFFELFLFAEHTTYVLYEASTHTCHVRDQKWQKKLVEKANKKKTKKKPANKQTNEKAWTKKPKKGPKKKKAAKKKPRREEESRKKKQTETKLFFRKHNDNDHNNNKLLAFRFFCIQTSSEYECRRTTALLLVLLLLAVQTQDSIPHLSLCFFDPSRILFPTRLSLAHAGGKKTRRKNWRQAASHGVRGTTACCVHPI